MMKQNCFMSFSLGIFKNYFILTLLEPSVNLKGPTLKITKNSILTRQH